VKRRGFLSLLGLAVFGAGATPAEAFFRDWEESRRGSNRRPSRRLEKRKKAAERQRTKTKKLAYKGREIVSFNSAEKPGTIIVKTNERALYQVLPNGKAKRFLVAVGKDGFNWSGVARIGLKKKNPTWTPPEEMIERSPQYAKWRGGMPGGIPENPLGVRALYLFDRGGDTMYRIHGTNAPSSIGTAASSGCIRMLNR
jgi:lipoprotein-anchoring transpeptidase ErfK/SrfK